jgi:hypothetical protein
MASRPVLACASLTGLGRRLGTLRGARDIGLNLRDGASAVVPAKPGGFERWPIAMRATRRKAAGKTRLARSSEERRRRRLLPSPCMDARNAGALFRRAPVGASELRFAHATKSTHNRRPRAIRKNT